MHGRNEHNIVKKLYTNKKYILRGEFGLERQYIANCHGHQPTPFYWAISLGNKQVHALIIAILVCILKKIEIIHIF